MRTLKPVLILSAAIISTCVLCPPMEVGHSDPSRSPLERASKTNDRSAWFIIPVAKSAVQQAVKKYSLAPLPLHDKRVFPNGFPASHHPVVVQTTYDNDIRRGNLKIDALMNAAVSVPYVDRLGDGTPFLYPISTYIGGANGQNLMGLVPGKIRPFSRTIKSFANLATAIVGSINTNPIKLGQITPDTAAYLPIGPDQYSSQVEKVTLPNGISGPKIAPSAIDLEFHTTRKPKYTAHSFHTMLNQPLILTSNIMGRCQRNNVYFNESFANPIMRKGTVTLYAPTIPKSLAGVYKQQYGYSANGELVGYNIQECRAAAKQNQPKPSV